MRLPAFAWFVSEYTTCSNYGNTRAASQKDGMVRALSVPNKQGLLGPQLAPSAAEHVRMLEYPRAALVPLAAYRR